MRILRSSGNFVAKEKKAEITKGSLPRAEQ